MEQVKLVTNLARLPWKWGVYLVVGLLVLGWLLETPAGLLGKADALGYAVCHRIDGRSLHIGDRQMPLCVRCTGQYLGAMVGLAFQVVASRRRSGMPHWSVIGVFVLFVGAYAVDGLNSYLHLSPLMLSFPDLPRLYEPNSTLRMLTGMGMGLVIAGALYPAFVGTVFRRVDPRPALPGLGWLAGMTLPAAALAVLALLEIPAVMYVLALVSAGGVLLLLTLVYTVVWLMVFRKENHYDNLAQLALPLVGGLAVALLQIAVMDGLRYALTGTWAGFPL